MIGVEEDKLCKPYRPIPSGRISLEQGQSLYLVVVALCVALSVYNGLTIVSLIYMPAIWLYNEVGLSMHPIPKNLLGAIGYMCYCWGTTYIIGKCLSPSSSLLVDIAVLRSSSAYEQYVNDSYSFKWPNIRDDCACRHLHYCFTFPGSQSTFRDMPKILETGLGMPPLVAKQYP